MNATSVAKPSSIAQALLDTRKFILEKSPICVMNVGKALVRVLSSSGIKEFIQETSRMNVMNVGKLLAKTQRL